MSFKPVIFLAFANDKVDQALYLRNLSAESHGINEALKAAAQSGLCEIVEKSSASVDDIINVFTDPRYKSRISIFHYGGHADGFSLLLEGTDGSKTLTHKDGLVPFLARQANLKLVFLNGCSSESQATDLLSAGIPAVIGTTSSINDAVATGLADRFYSSLGDGANIEKAWADATDEVKIEHGTKDTRALYWEGKKETNHHFPWVIQFKPGAGKIRSWNLPDISGNPLYGLPAIPETYNLPESPFLYLHRYERKHAEIFFGRSNYIRNLYSSVRDTHAPPIILLYGLSGVGKSSLLEAGLQPRLEASYEILYLRRNGLIGLRKTLYFALLKAAGYPTQVDTPIKVSTDKTDRLVDVLKNLYQDLGEKYKPEIDSLINKIVSNSKIPEDSNGPDKARPNSIKKVWKELEKKLKKPILVILDQVEEAYTRPNKQLENEINELFVDLKNLFGNPNNVPTGKILLSFRKEFHPEIEEYCKKYELPRSKIFIKPITAKDVSEVFKGFSESPRLQARYNLKIEDGLPDIIATQIAADKDSPIAPLLQILLTKMWNKAKSDNPEAPEFSRELYRDLKEKGLAMDAFLQSQLHHVRRKMPEQYRQGLVFDLLRFFCTPNGTAAARTEKHLQENYPSATEEVAKVLEICNEYFLITDIGGTDKKSMLAHDTLAKSVIKLQLQSALPLQQAKRVLASKMETVKGGAELSTFDSGELNLIDSVVKYFPAFSAVESKLIADSRKVILKKEKDKKRWAHFKTVVFFGSFIALLIVSALRIKSTLLEQVSSINHMAASSVTNLPTDPTLAFQQAIQGYDKSEALKENNYLGIAEYFGIASDLKETKESAFTEIEKALSYTFYSSMIYDSLPRYTNRHDSSININAIIVHKDQKRMIPFYETDSFLPILNFNGEEKGKLHLTRDIKDNEGNVKDKETTQFTNIQWSHDGSNIITLNNEGFLQIFDQKGDPIHFMNGQQYHSYDVSPNGFLMAITNDTINDQEQDKIRIFDTRGNPKDSINVSSKTSHIKFTPDGQDLVLIDNSTPSMIRLAVVNLQSKKRTLSDPIPGPARLVKVSASGNLIAVATPSGIMVWDKNGRKINKIKPTDHEQSLEVYDMAFHPFSDSTIVISTRDKSAYIYNVYGQKKRVALSHDITVTSASFSDNGKMIMTCSGDNTASIWNLSGKKLYELKGHDNDVTSGVFIDNDQQVLTSSLDGSVLQWNLDEYQVEILPGHKSEVNYIALDSTQRYLVSSGADFTVRLWDLRTKKEIDSIGFMNQETRYVSFIDTNNIIGFNGTNAFSYNIPNKKLVSYKDEGHTDSIEWLEVFRERVITVGKDSSIIFWGKTSGKPIKKIKSPYGITWDLDISKKYGLVAVGTEEGKIMLINYDGELVDTLDEHTKAVNYIDISPNGLFMVSASKDGTAIIWDLNLKQKQAPLKDIGCAVYNTCEVISANFSHDGQMVVTASSDRSVRVWDLNGDLLAHMEGHSNPIVDAFFAHDDEMVYSFSEDHTVKLWSLKGEEITSVPHTVKINSATMDENHIYSASDDGKIRIWLTPSGVYQRQKDKDARDR